MTLRTQVRDAQALPFAAVGEQGRAGLEQELVAVFEAHNTATDGTMAIDVPYLEVVGVRS